MIDLSDIYKSTNFIRFLHSILPKFDEDIRNIDNKNRKYKNIENIKYLGKDETIDLAIFEVDHISSNESRIKLASDGFKLMKMHGFSRSLITYRSKKDDNWRLSLLTSNPILSKGKIIQDISDPRRYSYILGPNAKIYTPKQFLIDKGPIENFDDLKSRFELEVVSKDFYNKIASSFIKLTGDNQNKALLRLPKKQSKIPIDDTIDIDKEFSVKLIGRIIFCWFLKSKIGLNNKPIIPNELLSTDAVKSNSNYYQNILEPLFFEVLNKKVDSRIKNFKVNPFNTIPYLNGGLFSPEENDYYLNFNINLTLQNRVFIPNEWFIEFFKVLETYNFTIDENTVFDQEISIDPEMLGRIFENLLAEIIPETGESARKETGSYYTNRVIVDQMIESSIFNYLITNTQFENKKIESLFKYDLSDEKKEIFTTKEKQKLIENICNIKILDPACGSGAFPISALQKIIFILEKIDPEGQLWFNNQVKNTPYDIKMIIEKEFKNQNFNYVRKLSIIRDNIFGIDIQSIASEISKLRCFLTLIVDQKIMDFDNNFGIKPLPNLEFKFVTANTLIKLQRQMTLFDNAIGINELKEIRSMYFNATGDERNLYKEKFYEIQKNILKKSENENSSSLADLSTQLSNWDPFSNIKQEWFDPEWMLGIESGFDIVISNPPYINADEMSSSEKGKKLRELIKKDYITTEGNWNLFIPFIEKGINLLKSNGILSFIIPNSLLNSKYASSARKYISNKNIIEIRDYSTISVFEDAFVYPITILLQNSNSSKTKATNLIKMQSLELINSTQIISGLSINLHSWDYYFQNSEIKNILDKLFESSQNDSLNLDIRTAGHTNQVYAIKDLMFDTNKILDSKKLITAGTIDKYKSLWGVDKTRRGGTVSKYPIIKNFDLRNLNKIWFNQANSKKVLVATMSKVIEAYYDDEGQYMYWRPGTIVLGEKKELLEFLGIINSKVSDFFVNFYYHSKKLQGGYINLNADIVKSIPVPLISDSSFHKLVEKQNNFFDKSRMDEINKKVYSMFNLSKNEISIIEKSIQN
tara:strand:- start:207 stop:3323 length:3117 start_codon:yes stop_codon:yes gene_type:complete